MIIQKSVLWRKINCKSPNDLNKLFDEKCPNPYLTKNNTENVTLDSNEFFDKYLPSVVLTDYALESKGYIL